MSCVEYLENETPVIKNEIVMSDLNLYGNEYISLKEEEKNEEKSLSEESNFQNFIKREFTKEITNKNNISDSEDDDIDDIRRYEIAHFKPLTTTNIINNNNFKPSTNFFTSLISPNILNDNKQTNPINQIEQIGQINPINQIEKKENNKEHKRIFNIVKIPKNKKIFQCLQRKREYGERSKKMLFDWDNIKVPKEKHFHFDRKKHRIVFQRRHLKVIYSIVDLTYPFNFNKCFDMIKKHIGDKTVQNYKAGKSFHIIKINNEEKIVTLKDKKMLLKESKMKKKLLNNNDNISSKENTNINTTTNNNKTLLFKEIYKK